MALEDAVNPMQGVSGPGSFAKRTDLQYQSPEYGDGVTYDAMKAAAPLAKSADVRGATNTAVRQAAAQAGATQGAGLYAPTQNPDQPITHGIDSGPGAGSEALMMKKPDDSNFVTNLRDYIPVLSYISSLPDTSPETRQILRQLRDQL